MWIKGTKSDTVINLDRCGYIDFSEVGHSRHILARFHMGGEEVKVIGVPENMTREDFIRTIMKAESHCSYYEVEEG